MNNLEVHLKNLIVYIMLLPGFVAGVVLAVVFIYMLCVLVGMDPIIIGRWANG